MAATVPGARPPRLAPLVTEASSLIQASLSSQTRISYEKSFANLCDFLKSIDISANLPINPGHLVLFISHLFNKGLASSTIISKMSAVTFIHRLNGFTDPSDHFLVQKALLGVKKSCPTADVRQPLSLDLLNQIIVLLQGTLFPSYSSTMFKAMLSISFFACLRPGEVTNSINNIDFSQVTCTTESVNITFCTFKHYHGRPITISVSSQRGIICPVKLLSEFLSLRGSSPGPFFIHPDSKPVSYSEYWSLFKQLNLSLKVSSKLSPHSPRIGGATHAAIMGFSPQFIQRLGRWHSDAYLKYIRIASFNV